MSKKNDFCKRVTKFHLVLGGRFGLVGSKSQILSFSIKVISVLKSWKSLNVKSVLPIIMMTHQFRKLKFNAWTGAPLTPARGFPKPNNYPNRIRPEIILSKIRKSRKS